MKTVVKFPGEHLPQDYFDVRYKVLRKPLGSPKGSEYLAKDNDAINVWVEVEDKVVAVGRAHLLEPDEDGSAYDVKAKSVCPSFAPLGKHCEPMTDDSGMMIGDDLRPAIQVRGMGTLDEFQGKGFASAVLDKCEVESVQLWKAKTGWLQARVAAIPFYERNGWTCFGPEYHVPNVGPHRSMWKKFVNLKH